MDQDRGFLDAGQPADARADQAAGAVLLLVGPGHPAGINHRLLGGRDAIDDEIIHAPQFLGIHPLGGVKGSVRAIATRHLAGDLRRQVVGLELGDGAGAGLAGEQA